jgi:heme-degrading monooxygenase HmoA
MPASKADISAGDAVITLINVFTVAPDKQDALVAQLARATEEVMKGMPGFVSTSILSSVDGTRVTNYAQWRTQHDFENMLKDPRARAQMTESAALAVTFEPVLYRVASVHAH